MQSYYICTMNNKFVAVIPARYASTRFPGKPLAEIGGKTMICRVWERASALFDRVVVATDDERIAAHVRAFGGVVEMTRADHPSGTDRIGEVAARLGLTDEIVVNVQGDEPFIDPSQLSAVCALFDDPTCQIGTLATPFASKEEAENPNAVKAVFSQATGTALYFSRALVPYLRNPVAHTYYKHVGLYAYRAWVLAELVKLPVGQLERCESLEQLRWLEGGYKIRVATTLVGSIGIDTPEDLAAAEHYINSKGV